MSEELIVNHILGDVLRGLEEHITYVRLAFYLALRPETWVDSMYEGSIYIIAESD